MKQGQVTIFVIAGIMLLILAYLFFSNVLTKEPIEQLEIDLKQAEIQFFVNGCVEHNLNEAISQINDFNQNNILFEREHIERELEYIILENLHTCIDNFSPFETYGIDIKEGPLDLKMHVGDKRTIANLNYSLNISKSEKIVFLNQFGAEIDFDYIFLKNSIQQTINSVAPEYFEYLTTNPSFSIANDWLQAPRITSTQLSYLTQRAMQEGFSYYFINDENAISTLILEFYVEELQTTILHTIPLPQEPYVSDEIFKLKPFPIFKYTGEDIIYEILSSEELFFQEQSDFLSITNNIMLISGDIPEGTTRELIKAINNNGEETYQYVIIKH